MDPSTSDRTGPSVRPSPRPLVRKKEIWGRHSKKHDDDGDLMMVFKMSLKQEQARREEEHRSRLMDREDEKRRAAADRRLMEQRWIEAKATRQEERERIEEDRRRSDQMMQMMMMATIGKSQPGSLVVQKGKVNNEGMCSSPNVASSHQDYPHVRPHQASGRQPTCSALGLFRRCRLAPMCATMRRERFFDLHDSSPAPAPLSLV